LSINVKIAVFAPIPSASDNTATTAKPRFFRKIRNAYRMSESIAPPDQTLDAAAPDFVGNG